VVSWDSGIEEKLESREEAGAFLPIPGWFFQWKLRERPAHIEKNNTDG
jgi:hypothetical protein